MSIHENPRKPGQILAGISALVLLRASFLPWFNWRADVLVIAGRIVTRNPHGPLTLWQTFPLIAYVLVFLGIVAIGVVLFRSLRPTGFPNAINILMMAFAAISAGVILLKIIMPPTLDMGAIFMGTATVKAGIGAFLALIAAIGIAVASGLSLHAGGRSATS